MKKLISGIKNYKKYLKTPSDFWLLITAYGWIFLIYSIIGLILVIFGAGKDAEIIIKFGAYFLGGILLSSIFLVTIKTIAGKKE